MSPAAGAVTIGTQNNVPYNVSIECFPRCSGANSAIPSEELAAGGLTSPISGVIVRWRTNSTDFLGESAEARLRVFNGNTGAGTSETVQLPSVDDQHQFPTRLPITEGARLGIEVDAGYLPVYNGPGYAFDSWGATPPEDLETETPAPNGSLGLPVNADVEPDADSDGYGDETQDQCPSDASTQGPCPVQPDSVAPKTTITKGAPNKTEKHKVKFKFRANEVGSTFECKKDRKPWKACTSPTKMKRLDEGKHKFKVRATDAAGNTGKPAKDKFKVVG